MVVHARHCAAVGMKDFTGCSTTPGECSLRYTFDYVRFAPIKSHIKDRNGA